mmetsp:Transcript_36669/g.72550  ORF Transcript_36669/g.72550 Transcript_36669/m.72550 type:complete len:202 (+) Transcript_36669:62-667(+)
MHQLPAHLIWQQRVDKERKALNRQVQREYRKHGLKFASAEDDPDSRLHVPPLHDLHRTLSSPSNLPAIDEQMPRQASAPLLPALPTSSPKPQGTLHSGSTPMLLGGDDVFGRGLVSSRSLSSRHSVGSRRRRERAGDGSQRSSAVGTSLTSLTTASLRREVEVVVAEEVARAVQPLRDRLQSEQDTRQRLEALLRRAKAGS